MLPPTPWISLRCYFLNSCRRLRTGRPLVGWAASAPRISGPVSAAQVTAVIPHYAYARSDKKDASRISIGGAKGTSSV